MKRLTILLLITLPLLFSCTGKEQEPQVIPGTQTVPVESVSIDQASASITIGETLQLSASVSPSTATNKEVTWSSSNQSVASVSSSGLVTALAEGTVTITASAGGKQGSCTVSVSPKIKLDKTNLNLTIDDSETLTATLAPSDAGKKVTWSSSDTKVATVEDGKITALAVGSATITAALDGYKAECTVTVKGMDYQVVPITDLKPVDILPVIGQVEVGDKQCYDHIEHLRLAEATRIRDMMWEYGAGSHSKEAYQQLMGRLVVGMMEECPSLSENFEFVTMFKNKDWSLYEDGHSHGEWSIFNSVVPNTRRIVCFSGFHQDDMGAFLTENPNSIVIMGCSSWGIKYGDQYKDKEFQYSSSEDSNIIKHCKSGRMILFRSGGNISTHNEVLANKCFNKEVKGDEHGIYSLQSIANGNNDAEADMALLVTIGTNDKGDADQTGCKYSSSCFPVGFHDQVLFAGRAFPFDHFGQVWSEKESVHAYQTSFVNYVNVAMMSVCFQMYAEAKDVFELLDMVRSTCLTDYIRLDGQTQPLQLINPAGLYKKYLTPLNLPESIATGETLDLEKRYYKGVIFRIPGAEVKIDGEWVAFDNKNKDTIIAQNPMNLEWRLNGNLLRKMGYTSGQKIEGQIITVDDKWGGLRLEVPIQLQIR